MESGVAGNGEAYEKLRWVLDNADRGFYIFTAMPAMQKKIAQLYAVEKRVALFDYAGREKSYSYGELEKWVEQQDAQIFFVINLQVALREEKDLRNFNLSRDMLAKTKRIWMFGMTPELDNRLAKYALDFYSYVRMRAAFADETPATGIEPLEQILPGTPMTQLKVDSYKDMEKQLMSVSIETTPADQLLSTAATLSNIAIAYFENGNYEQALALFEKERIIREKVQGKEHPDTATTYNNIASVYDSQGDYARALKWHEKALVIREKVQGKEHPDTARIYNNIAGIYDNQGDYARALEWYFKALTICEHVLGTEHPSTATIYNNIALVYNNQGDYARALEWCLKDLAIREKVLGKEHPSTAKTYDNIASVYIHQGDYAHALEWYFKALTIFEKVLGKEHPDMATTYNNIAFVYDNQGDYARALKWHERALVVREKTLGKEHPSTISTRNNIATVQAKLEGLHENPHTP